MEAMTSDMQSLLLNLPIPMFLINKATNKVLLANKDTCQVLSINKC